jgi:hypothetical protein
MSTLHSVILLLHLLSMAILVGGFASQAHSSSRSISPGQKHASISALITGLLLVAFLETSQAETATAGLNHSKIALKLLISLALCILCFMPRAKRPWQKGWLASGMLSITNTSIAVLWS